VRIKTSRRKFTIRTSLVIIIAATVGVALAATLSRAELSQRDAQALADKDLIYIATVRKDGNQSKAVPVWFTTSADKTTLLIQTGPNSWKAKRIRRGSPALVWIGSANGPAFIARAEITDNAAVKDKILDDFRHKYWQNRVLGIGPSRAAFDKGERIAIVITPVRDLSTGFTSSPGTPAPPLETTPSAPKSP